MDLGYAVGGVLSALVAATFFAAAWGWGYGALLVARRLGPVVDGPLVEIALGSGALGYVAFALGLVGWLRPPVLGAVLLAGIALLGWSLRRAGRPWNIPVDAHGPERGSRLLAWGAAAAVGGALLFALLGAMLPEIQYDAVWYHLNFPRRYLESGFLVDFPCDHMSPTPQHVELLYGYGLVFGDARAAKLIHLGFGVLAGLWAALMAARLAGPRWAPVAAGLFLTAPTVTWEMTTAYNELPLAFVATGAVAVLLEWRKRPDRRPLVVAGLLLGIGLAGKHLAMFFLAPIAVGVLLVPVGTASRGFGRRCLDAALLCVVAVAVALPWYVRAWVLTGNPLFPMFYDQLTALGVHVRRWDAQAQRGWWNAMRRYGHGRTPGDLLLLPFRATWDSLRYSGSVGPAWLMGLPIVALTWTRLSRDARLMAGLVVVFILLWVSPWSSFQIRYLVPVAPLVAVLLATTGREFAEMLDEAGWPAMRRAVELGLVAMLVLNLPLFTKAHDARSGWVATAMHNIGPGAWRTAVGAYDHHRYLRERLESYQAVQHVNELVPREGRVVWFGEAAHFYAVPELLMDFSRCVGDATWAPPGQEERAYRALRAAGVTHIAWDLTRTDVAAERFAIRSSLFRTRFAKPVYRDDVMEIDALRPAPIAGTSAEAR